LYIYQENAEIIASPRDTKKRGHRQLAPKIDLFSDRLTNIYLSNGLLAPIS